MTLRQNFPSAHVSFKDDEARLANQTPVWESMDSPGQPSPPRISSPAFSGRSSNPGTGSGGPRTTRTWRKADRLSSKPRSSPRWSCYWPGASPAPSCPAGSSNRRRCRAAGRPPRGSNPRPSGRRRVSGDRGARAPWRQSCQPVNPGFGCCTLSESYHIRI